MLRNSESKDLCFCSGLDGRIHGESRKKWLGKAESKQKILRLRWTRAEARLHLRSGCQFAIGKLAANRPQSGFMRRKLLLT